MLYYRHRRKRKKRYFIDGIKTEKDEFWVALGEAIEKHISDHIEKIIEMDGESNTIEYYSYVESVDAQYELKMLKNVVVYDSKKVLD